MEIGTDPSPLGFTDWTSKIDKVSEERPYLPGVISHEFGHAAGLGHSASAGDLMYTRNEYTSTTTPSVLFPAAGDVDAMKALYR